MIYKLVFAFLFLSFSPLFAQDFSRANSLFNEGSVLYEEGKFVDAIESYNNAEEIYLKLSKEEDLSAYTSLWRGIAYNSLFEYESAIIDLKKSINKAMKQNIQDVLLSAWSYLADSYYSLDNWSDAYNTYDSALKYAKKLNKFEYFPALYEGLGNIEFAWGKYDTAEVFYNLALESAEKQNMQENIIKISIGFGRIEHARNNLEESIKIYKTLLQRPGIESSLFYSSIVNSLGTVYYYSGEVKTALQYYGQAMISAKENGNTIEIIRLLIHIGGAYHILEKYEDALDSYSEALALTEIFDRQGDRSICLYNMGLAHVYLNSLKEAIPYFEKSIEIKETLRLSASGIDRLDYLSSEVHVYQWLSSTYLEDGNFNKAIDAIEKSSSKYLIEQLGYDNSDSLAFAGTESVQNKLSNDEIIITYAGSSTPRLSVLTISKTELDGMFLFPENLGLRFTIDDLTNYNNLNNLYGSNFSASGEKVNSNIENLDFESIVNYYRLLLISGENIELIHTLGRYMYDYFIAPIENELNKYKKIIINPDGILAFLPFETFIMPDGRYLVEKFDISYIQSLAVSEIIKTRNYSSARKDFIGFGGADYASFDVTSTSSNYSFLNINRWNNLPGTISEIDKIGSLYDTQDIYSGENLTESLVKKLSEKNVLKRFKIIHFAVHGLVLPEKPWLSALVLTDPDIFKEDGYLNINEIVKLDLEADFVNLSACETGLGKIYGGEGVVGLAQAFLIAGANSMSVSLWQVADNATKEFMVGLYKLVTYQNYTFNQGMSEMKRKFIASRRYNHPYYWAPFIFYGE